MKSSKQCPKCHSLRIGYFDKVIDRSDVDDHSYGSHSHIGRTKDNGFFSRGKMTGELEAYVCAECGFFETYVKSPTALPWEKLDNFHWVNHAPADDSPYR